MEINVKGHIVLIDESDYHLVSQYKWRVHPRKKYVMSFKMVDRKVKTIYLHRLLLGLNEPTRLADHINRNPLDNRRKNLRVANYSQNSRNTTPSGSSKYLGVSVFQRKGYRGKSICSTIYSNGQRKYLGYFKTEIEAAMAYNEAAKIIHGEFANLNKID